MNLIKLMLIVPLITLFQIANAQDEITNNNFVLGGSVSFMTQNNTFPFTGLSINSGIGGIYSNSTNDTKNTSFSITPYFGKELNSRLLLGLQLDYRVGKYTADNIFIFGQTNQVDFERNSNQFGIGVFARYTLNPDQQFNFYLQPSFEYNLLNEEESQDSDITQEEKANYFHLTVIAGVLYNINNKVRATLRTGGLSYVNGKWKIVGTDVEKSFSSFGTNVNLSSISFGFEIKI